LHLLLENRFCHHKEKSPLQQKIHLGMYNDVLKNYSESA
jgi:hypothetical protein